MKATLSALTHLECPQCGRTFAAGRVQTICKRCQSPLLARYDLERVAVRWQQQPPQNGPRGLWRWGALLPLQQEVHRVSLGEGDTPLLPLPRLGKKLGLKRLFVKDESQNPTGTFKARGLALAVSRAKELGVRGLVMPTAGNAGGALAAYAARAGLPARVFMPQDAPQTNQQEVLAAGAQLERVPGDISDAARAAVRARRWGWLNVATFHEPYRVEGKKTMGLELAAAGNWRLPDVIIYPTGGGTGLVGMWKAFTELQAMGWLQGPLPRMVSVQAAGCAPVVRAWEEGAKRVKPWSQPATVAAGLRVPAVFADRLVLHVLRESDGRALAVSDDAIRAAARELAQEEGVLASPEGAATLAALLQLLAEGWVLPDAHIVLFNTGAGLKYLPAGEA